jgi:hypothetical protein
MCSLLTRLAAYRRTTTEEGRLLSFQGLRPIGSRRFVPVHAPGRYFAIAKLSTQLYTLAVSLHPWLALLPHRTRPDAWRSRQA